MRLEVAEMAGGKGAPLAPVLAVDAVLSPVQRRAGGEVERGRTEAALVHQLAGVHAHVVAQALGGEEGQQAELAREALDLQVRLNVLVQAELAPEGAGAQVARESIGLRVRVHVPVEHGLVNVLGRADSALERPAKHKSGKTAVRSCTQRTLQQRVCLA